MTREDAERLYVATGDRRYLSEATRLFMAERRAEEPAPRPATKIRPGSYEDRIRRAGRGSAHRRA